MNQADGPDRAVLRGAMDMKSVNPRGGDFYDCLLTRFRKPVSMTRTGVDMTSEEVISPGVDKSSEGASMDKAEIERIRKMSPEEKEKMAKEYEYFHDRPLFTPEYRAKYMSHDHYNEEEEKEKEKNFNPSRQVKVVDEKGRTRILYRTWATGIIEKGDEERAKRPWL